ncbi:MAG: hypothetical protein JSR82_24350 [Verrucomicrobia bacterium]|nr:hypothetical protein [Verrucomicrobiota bacterium]
MSNSAATCAGCGQPRPEGKVACHPCWNRLPFLDRQQFTKAGLEGRRKMLPGILEQLKRMLATAAALLLALLPLAATATPDREAQLRAAVVEAQAAGEAARVEAEAIARERDRLQEANESLRTGQTQTLLQLGRAEAEATRLKIDADTNAAAAQHNAQELARAKVRLEETTASRDFWRWSAVGLALLAGLYVFLRLHPATRLIIP